MFWHFHLHLLQRFTCFTWFFYCANRMTPTPFYSCALMPHLSMKCKVHEKLIFACNRIGLHTNNWQITHKPPTCNTPHLEKWGIKKRIKDEERGVCKNRGQKRDRIKGKGENATSLKVEVRARNVPRCWVGNATNRLDNLQSLCQKILILLPDDSTRSIPRF